MFFYHGKACLIGHLQTLSQICFPGLCVLCGSELLFVLRDGIPLCYTCRPDPLSAKAGQNCRVCSRLLLSEQKICTYCRRREYHFEHHRTLFRYSGRVRELLYQYKFKAIYPLGAFWARCFATLPSSVYSGMLLVPVPGTPAGRRKRGWDHMELIARQLASLWQVPWQACLGRKQGSAQKALGFQARRENLVNRIHLKRSREIAGQDILLLDDIFTTGATLSECARVLKERGAGRVEALTLAQD